MKSTGSRPWCIILSIMKSSTLILWWVESPLSKSPCISWIFINVTFLPPGCLHAVHQHCGPLSRRHEFQSASPAWVYSAWTEWILGGKKPQISHYTITDLDPWPCLVAEAPHNGEWPLGHSGKCLPGQHSRCGYSAWRFGHQECSPGEGGWARRRSGLGEFNSSFYIPVYISDITRSLLLCPLPQANERAQEMEEEALEKIGLRSLSAYLSGLTWPLHCLFPCSWFGD